MRHPWKALAPQYAPLTGTGARAYGLAVVATVVSVALTRYTWPLFASTPFAPLFAGIVVTTHWGTRPAGLLAVGLSIAGAVLAFPTGGQTPWDPRTLLLFIPVALVGTRIIAGRNRTAAALRASEAQLRATWEHVALGAALVNPMGRIERVNPALERLLGYPEGAAAGTPFTAVTDPDEAAAEQQRFDALMRGSEAFYQREQRYRRQDGTFLWGRVTVSAIRGLNRIPTGALAVLEDVTAQRQDRDDLRESEQRLRRAQKMEAVGQLVAGVAHNFNNLLTVTMGYTDVLLDQHRGLGLPVSELEEIRKATNRGAALTRQLLAFGRKHDPRPARIDLNRAVAALRETLTRVIREDIHLAIEVESSPLIALVDPFDLEQVIFNLAINARDALPGGGLIRIVASGAQLEAGDVPSDVALPPGGYVRLCVEDNGTGMTADVQSHLFEPFFTTKDVGEGTGLGLAFVHGIAQHGRGFVQVRSAPGQGTRVCVYLPRLAAETDEAAADPALPAIDGPRGSATILLVEDEEAVRSLAARTLSAAGYRVLAAATPGDACALFATHPDIDLLLTDIVMPDMHGTVLAERFVAERPQLPVLFVSGYADTMPAGTAAPGRVAFLAKPFSASRLLSTVADLLAARTS